MFSPNTDIRDVPTLNVEANLGNGIISRSALAAHDSRRSESSSTACLNSQSWRCLPLFPEITNTRNSPDMVAREGSRVYVIDAMEWPHPSGNFMSRFKLTSSFYCLENSLDGCCEHGLQTALRVHATAKWWKGTVRERPVVYIILALLYTYTG